MVEISRHVRETPTTVRKGVRFDPFATPSVNDRSLRIAVVHFVVFAWVEFPQ